MNRTVIPMQLDSSIAIKLSMGGSMFQERNLMSRSDVWHKVRILKGTHYDKETVLKAILNAIDPAELVPVKYQSMGEDTYFLARNCAHALDKLCKTNLIIKNPEGDPLILIVTLGFASIHELKINLQPFLLAALAKKYDPNKKSLNLELFHKDPDVSKTVYCPLSQQRIFNHVMKLTKTAIATVEHLSLQKNELTNLTPIKTCGITTIKYLDLRHNNLYSMEVLAPLKNLGVLKLWLDGNPLCENYSKPKLYIDSAKKYCPNLIQLDGVYVKNSGLPFTYSNYAKNEASEDLAAKFVNHFFSLYDQGDRSGLKGLYHKNAFFSISLGIPSVVAQKKKLGHYMTICRNLTKNTNLNKKRDHLYHGHTNILDCITRLPQSYHDKNSFVCDLIYDDGQYLSISVSGLFKNLANPPQVLAFNRTFVLLAGPDNEYNITNDQYYIEMPAQEIPAHAIETKSWYEAVVPVCFSATEKKELYDKFVNVTTLNDEWTHTYLNEAKWDLRKAITLFMKDYKSSAVPPDAFIK